METQIRILLVDDEDRYRDQVATLIQRHDGMEVTSVADAATAVDHLSEREYDCVVSDYQIPGPDGLDLARFVRPSFPRLPFVLLTAEGSEQTASDAFSAGVSEYFRKDGDVTVLCRRIRTLVEKSRAERSELETKRRYRTLTEESTDLIATVDADGTITYHSDSLRRTLGLEPGSVVGRNVVEMTHVDDRERVREALVDLATAAADGERRIRRLELRLRDADGDWRWFESTARNTFEEAVDGFVVNSREVTDRRRREEAIGTLHDATREMMAAETPGAVESVVLDAASDVLGLGLVSVYRFDEDGGRLEPQTWSDDVEELIGSLPTFGRGEGLAWEAFAAGESRVYDDVTETGEAYNPDTSIRSELLVPIGTHGLFVSGDTDVGSFDDVEVDAVEILCANAETAVEQLDREAQLREQEADLRRQTSELEQLAHGLDVVRNALQAQYRSDSRREIEQTTCDRLAAAEPYRFAWLGRIDSTTDRLTPETHSGVGEGFPESLDRRLVDDAAVTPGARAATTGEMVVLDDVLDDRTAERRTDALDRGYRSIAGVPVSDEDLTYGALEVYAGESDRFDGRERTLLADLGRSVGSAITGLDRRATMAGEVSVEATYTVRCGTLFHWRLSTDLDCRVRFRGTGDTDGETTTLFVELSDVATDAVDRIATESYLGELRIVSTEPILIEVATTAPTAIETVDAHAGRLRSLSVDAGVGDLTAAFACRSNVRSFADAVSEYADGVDLRACETVDEDPTAVLEPRQHLTESLTDRQRELLQAAYFGGYFERSRTITGEDLAASFDLNHSTVYEHLRAGQRTVFGELFGSDEPD